MRRGTPGHLSCCSSTWRCDAVFIQTPFSFASLEDDGDGYQYDNHDHHLVSVLLLPICSLRYSTYDRGRSTRGSGRGSSSRHRRRRNSLGFRETLPPAGKGRSAPGTPYSLTILLRQRGVEHCRTNSRP